MKTSWPLLLLVCLTQLFGGRFAERNPPNADAALQAAVEAHSFHEIDGLKLQTSAVNIFSTKPLWTLLLSYFVVSAQKFKTLWLSHYVTTETLLKTIKEIAQTVETATDIGLLHQD